MWDDKSWRWNPVPALAYTFKSSVSAASFQFDWLIAVKGTYFFTRYAQRRDLGLSKVNLKFFSWGSELRPLISVTFSIRFDTHLRYFIYPQRKQCSICFKILTKHIYILMCWIYIQKIKYNIWKFFICMKCDDNDDNDDDDDDDDDDNDNLHRKF